ncbi:hypothetical protein ACF3MZ_02310 [Paenibacillaceae bacterium WGS1546]|uniref:hypothetical protein n=1 Tax=Cohnella sp. WGS1546 TaxID=3366810 RepID=UPI00372D47D4
MEELQISIKYNFKVSTKAEQYCDAIMNEMLTRFNISFNEALKRMNRHWSGNSFDDVGMLFHMLPEEGANEIYYGADSFWWKKDKKDLKPLPFNEEA